MARLDERDRWRERLSAAMAEEHRLHEAAVREEQAAARWAERAALAERKEAPDLADAARQRLTAHQRRAQSYRAEWARQQAQIAALKATVLQRGPATRPTALLVEGYDPVARRLAALEREDRLERDLAELKDQLGRA